MGDYIWKIKYERSCIKNENYVWKVLYGRLYIKGHV